MTTPVSLPWMILDEVLEVFHGTQTPGGNHTVFVAGGGGGCDLQTTL
jgi:hypothetical protein